MIWRTIIHTLILVVGLLLCKEGAESLALTAVGEEVSAHIGGASRVITRSGIGYNTFYEFTTPDRRTFSGRGRIYTRGAEPRGFVKTRYLPAYPAVNSLHAAGVLGLWGALCVLGGGGLLVFGLRRAARRARAARAAGQGATYGEPALAGALAVVSTLGIALYLDPVDWLGSARRGAPVSLPRSARRGNLAGNLLCGGALAAQHGWIYAAHDGIYRLRPDGTQRSRLSQDRGFQLNVEGDWLYYLNFDDGMAVYRHSITGAQRERLLKGRAAFLQVVGEWMFFTLEDNDRKLYRARTDGTQQLKLNDDESLLVNVAGDWIYYVNGAEGYQLGGIYRIRNNGAERQRIGEDRAAALVVEGDWLYYTNAEDAERIYRMRPDGSGRLRLNEQPSKHGDRTLCLNVVDDWLYYRNGEDGWLYRVPAAGGAPPVPLNRRITHEVAILEGWLFYAGGLVGSQPLWRIPLAGGEAVPIAR